MKVNEMVKIHTGSNSVGTMFIYEKHITGTVVKVNEKSVRVHMTHVVRTTNGKVVDERDMNETATFTFWKTVEKSQFGKNAGKTVSYYKNKEFGLITVVH